MTTMSQTNIGAYFSSKVMDLHHHDVIQRIQPYTGEKLNDKKWNTFELGFMAPFIEYNLKEVLNNNVRKKI